MPKYACINRTISETMNSIKLKFEDEAATTSYTSWVGYHYPKPTPTSNMADGLDHENGYDIITLPRMIRFR